MGPVEVVVAADVLVAALSRVSAAAIRFPAMPRRTNHPQADVIGAFLTADGDFALILSEEILEQVCAALMDEHGLAWEFAAVDQAADVLVGIAEHSLGGLVAPASSAELPAGGGPVEAAALRAAAAEELGFPRAVVTDQTSLQRLRTWRPRGVPWPDDQLVTLLAPGPFRDLVERARWRYRRM